jgi:hypothetical protein
LFVLGHQHLSTLVAALLGARALVLDVVAWYADFDKASDQVPHMGIAAVARVRVSNDEGPEVMNGGCRTLCIGHPQAQVMLVSIRRKQGAHEHRGLVGHLAERIACQVGSRILGRRALGRGGPAAEVDPFDARPLHRDCLPGRIRAKGRDAFSFSEELPQASVERRGRLAGNRVVLGDRAALLDNLTRGVETDDSRKAVAVDPLLGLGHFLIERTD